MQKHLLIIIINIMFNTAQAQLSKVVSGKIEQYANFVSEYTDARTVEVWLPANYDGKKKYAVLYMHDGQMLFDPERSWNHQSWNIDDVTTKLLNEKKIKDVIVVGIYNGGESRHPDFMPQKPFESLTQLEQEYIYSAFRPDGSLVFRNMKVKSDNYLKFIVKELKPFIDKKYATRADMKNTIIMGSSMGGMISLYAICEYPKVFGGAACLSTHWTGIYSNRNNPIPGAMINYLKANLPSAKNHKIYMDHGTATLDTLYEPTQIKVNELMKAKGYTDKNFITKVFVGADHSEAAWNKRVDIPLMFLLGK